MGGARVLRAAHRHQLEAAVKGPLHGFTLTRAVESHPVWREVAPEFGRHEFRYPDRMSVEFLRLLHRVRARAGVAFRIVSDARLGTAGVSNSAHNELPCCAVDLRVINSAERFAIVRAAVLEGFTRIGIYPPNEHQRTTWGKNSGSVHLDASSRLPQGVSWVDY